MEATSFEFLMSLLDCFAFGYFIRVYFEGALFKYVPDSHLTFFSPESDVFWVVLASKLEF
jgi:hypothetical protein